MQALDNLSVIANYDKLSEKTKVEMEELKQTVLDNYQQFTIKFQ